MNDATIYTDASKAQAVVDTMLDADRKRRENRSLITQIFDGWPPYTEEEATENNIETNVNFLEGTVLMQDARNQYRNALLKPGSFFTIRVDGFKDVSGRSKAGKYQTKELNKILKESHSFGSCLKSGFANVALHGRGHSVWPDRDSWQPVPYGLNDILIPDKTQLDLSNLNHFAVYREYVPYEFWRLVSSGNKGWNMGLVRKVMAEVMHKIARADTETEDYRTFWNPERVTEQIKENAGYYASDAVPTIKTWTLYTRHPDGKTDDWMRYVLLDDPKIEGVENDFLYNSKESYASDHREILHTFWGNISNQAPFRVHTVRSLGFLLYSVVQLMNRLRCRFNDALFQELLWYFRVQDPSDRDRIQRIDLHHLGIIPEGVSIVGRDERWTPDMNLIHMGLSENRRLMGEAAMSYRGRRENEERAPMTARQAGFEASTVQQMVTSILGAAYDDATFMFREIARRFAKKGSVDKDVKLFQKRIRNYDIPAAYMDPDRWEIVPTRTLGGGNKAIEAAQSQLLMSVRGMLDPDAQRKALHLFVESNTDDCGLADEMVPMDAVNYPSRTVIEAQQASGVLLMGLPVGIPQEVNRGEYIAAAIQSLSTRINQIEQSERKMPKDIDELRGLMNLSSHIAQNIEIMAEDQGQNQFMAQMRDALNNANNMVRAFGQRLQASMQAGSSESKMMAEQQAILIKEQTKQQARLASVGQQAQLKQEASLLEQERIALAHQQQLAQDAERHQLEIEAEQLKTAAKLRAL